MEMRVSTKRPNKLTRFACLLLLLLWLAGVDDAAESCCCCCCCSVYVCVCGFVCVLSSISAGNLMPKKLDQFSFNRFLQSSSGCEREREKRRVGGGHAGCMLSQQPFFSCPTPAITHSFVCLVCVLMTALSDSDASCDSDAPALI